MHALKSAGGLRAAAFFVILLIACMATPQWALSAATGQPVAYVLTPNSTVTVIDTGNHQVLNTITLDTATDFQYVVGRPDGTKVYVTGIDYDTSSYFVRVIDARTGTTTKKIPLPMAAFGMVISVDGSRIYVVSGEADIFNAAVSVIDTATDAVIANIDDPAVLPNGIAVSPDGKRVYVSMEGGLEGFGSFDVIDTASNTLLTGLGVDNAVQQFFSVGVSPDSAKFYTVVESCCANNYQGPVVLSAATNKITGTIAGLSSAVAFGIPLPGSTTLYGTNGGSLVVFSTQTDTVTLQVPVATRIAALALTPDDKQLYVANSNTQSIAIVDTASNVVTGSIAVSGVTSVAIIAAPPPPVTPAVTVTLGVSPASIPLGAQAVVTWSSTNATSCTPSGGWSGPVTLQGSSIVSPPAVGTYTLTLTCTGSAGTASASAKLVVTQGSTLTLLASDIPLEGSTTTSWTAFPGATACSASGTAWSGSLPISGSRVITPPQAGTYTLILTCTASSGLSASTSKTLTVYTPGPVPWVNLKPANYNVHALGTLGTPTVGGGLAQGYAYFGTALAGSQPEAFGQRFVFAPVSKPTGASNESIALGSVPLSSVTLLATAVNGNQLNQPFVVTYSDGTRQTFTQSLSDWGHSQKYAGEQEALETTARLTASGALQFGTYFVYAYQFALDPTKIATSLQLPKNRDVVVLAVNVTLVPQAAHDSIATAYNVQALASEGRTSAGGRLAQGYAYDASLVPSGFSGAGQTFVIGPKDQPDAVSSGTLALPAKNTVSLTVLATAVDGPQAGQAFVVTYKDGTTTLFTQGVSDWRQAQHFAGETLARSTAARVTPTGATQAGPWNLYAYTFRTDPNKPIASLKLPDNRNVVVLAVNSVTQ